MVCVYSPAACVMSYGSLSGMADRAIVVGVGSGEGWLGGGVGTIVAVVTVFAHCLWVLQ